jgi:hypothetical protein
MAFARVRGAVKKRTSRIMDDDKTANPTRSLRYSSLKAVTQLLEYTTKHYAATNDDNLKVLRRRLVQAGIYDPRAVAFFFIPLVTITLSGLPPHRIPSASGVSNFARITAGAFGTSISTTLWENRAAMHHAHLAETINTGNSAATQTLSNLQAAGFDSAQSLAMLDRLLNVQAYVLSADDIFYGSAVIFLLLVPLVWLTHPRKAGATEIGGAH